MSNAPSPDTSTQAAPGREYQELRLGALPRLTSGRRFRRWLVVALIVQFVATGATLIALQTPWRTQLREGDSFAVANLAAARLADQFLHASNPLAQRTLDSIASTVGVRFAVVMDARGRLVMSSGTHSLARLAAKPGDPLPPSVANLAAGRVSYVDGVFTTVVPIDPKSSYRLVLGMSDHSETRVLLDGAIAAGLGLACTLIFVVPFAFWRVRASANGLHALHKAIRRLAKGIPPDPVRIDGDDEIAYLGLAFNSMASDIMVAQKALRDANTTLEMRVAERTAQLGEANEALARKNAMLAEVTDTALRFTDDVAHEFRTPLAVILEFAAIISDGLSGDVSREQSEHLAFIIDAGKDLSHLVDDFLDSSRLRAGRLPVHRHKHHASSIVHSAWKMLEAKGAGRNVKLRSVIPPSMPLVLADEDKARRIIINLVGNAIKFSNSGDEVVVEARELEHVVEFRVTDHGPGMSAADVASLFARFRQTTTGARTSVKGFGLGLSITAELVGICLGTVRVESVLGSGSTFSFTLPKGDVESVIQVYLDHVAERFPTARIGAIVASAGTEPEDRQSLELALGDALYPHDLQVPCDDEHSILILGRTDDLDTWRGRIGACLNERLRSGSGTTRPYTLEKIGSWSLADLRSGGWPTIVAAAHIEGVHSA